MRKPAANDDEMLEYLRRIHQHDDQGLAGIRTVPELAVDRGITRSAARCVIDRLAERGAVECVGVIQDAPSRSVGWKIA